LQPPPQYIAEAEFAPSIERIAAADAALIAQEVVRFASMFFMGREMKKIERGKPIMSRDYISVPLHGDAAARALLRKKRQYRYPLLNGFSRK
jgi:hypothetical protein